MTWMDLDIVILSEVVRQEKDKYHMIPLTHMESKRYDTNQLIYRTETGSIHRLRG